MFRSGRLLVRCDRLSHSLHRFRPLQSQSPEQTVLIFAVFPRPSKSFNICHGCICQGCCLTNWAIADDLMLIRMHSMGNECPQPRKTFQSGLTFFQAGKSHFLRWNFKLRLIFYIYLRYIYSQYTSLEIVPKYECVEKLKQYQ